MKNFFKKVFQKSKEAVSKKPVRQAVKFDKNLLDKNAVKVINAIHKAGYEVYLVGGCVRDLLLGLKPKDFDIATSAKPEQVNKLFKRSRLIGRRFRLVHVLFGVRDFLEVATFRSGKVQTAKNGAIVRDNHYGKIEDDVVRRDFNINALYYDIHKEEVIDYVGGLKDLEAGEIHMIGNAAKRFSEDPVRMIRAVRFSEKLGSEMSEEIKAAILKQASLLANVPSARLFEECIKLFQNEYSFAVYECLEKYGLLKYLFKQTHKNDFIKKACNSTSERIKVGKPVTPVFLFSVFLWQAQNERFTLIKKKQRSFHLAQLQACDEAIINQIRQVSIPRYLTARMRDVWMMQAKLEKMHPKKVQSLLEHRGFRIAYDFLVLRSQSINPELKKVADFWTKVQK